VIILGFRPKSSKTKAVAVAFIVTDAKASVAADGDALERLAGFRSVFYQCLTARADALFELTDAVLCADGPVTSLPELSLAWVFRRGHGALYGALAEGSVDIAQLRRTLAGMDLPRDAQGRLWFGVDVTPWPRPDAECSPGRCHCWSPCRCDGTRQTIPGWPYQVVAALERGRSSWTAPLDAVRLSPARSTAANRAASVPRRDQVIDAFLALAHAIITLRRLIRCAWNLYRWDARTTRRP
jgi:DDE superfamily endonuclease